MGTYDQFADAGFESWFGGLETTNGAKYPTVPTPVQGFPADESEDDWLLRLAEEHASNKWGAIVLESDMYDKEIGILAA